LAQAYRPRPLAEREADGMGARTRNSYAASWSAFANWCVDTHRLTVNPFARLAKANENGDARRKRRALNADDLARLIAVAHSRPVVDAMTIRRGKRKGELAAKVSDGQRRKLETLGHVRGLTYKMLTLTGLRLNEVRSLTIGGTDLGGPTPYATLQAADEKARRGAEIPLRTDLAADLARHLADRLKVAQRAAKRQNRPIPARLSVDAPLIDVPKTLGAVLDRDLVAAGLATRKRAGNVWRYDKRDERGRCFDVHAFRMTFNSLLAAAGVPLTTRRILMRHAPQGVTDEHYADTKLIDLRAALHKLPDLPLDDGREGEDRQATGTDGRARFAPGFAPTPDNLVQTGANSGSAALATAIRTPSGHVANGRENQGVTTADKPGHESGRWDSNPQHSAWKADTLPIELHPHGARTSSMQFYHTSSDAGCQPRDAWPGLRVVSLSAAKGLSTDAGETR